MLRSYLLGSIIFSSMYNIVRFFEYQVECVPERIYNHYVSQHYTITPPHKPFKNQGENGNWYSIVQEQDVYHESDFRTVVAITDSFVLGLIPLLLLMFFNISIFIMVQREKKIISKTTDIPLDPKDRSKNKNRKADAEDVKMAMVLMAIVGVFIFCYLF